MSDILSTISTMIIEGNFVDIMDKTNAALEEGLGADELLNNGLMPGMDHVGVEFKAGNMFVPEVLRSAKAMQESMDILRPILAEKGIETAGKIVIGTVKGDLHDIGKNLVGMMCEGAGFEIIDLGNEFDFGWTAVPCFPEGFFQQCNLGLADKDLPVFLIDVSCCPGIHYKQKSA